MGMKFTADQQTAIALRGSNILVSAAAGSGKTAVLVERIVQLVSDPENGTDIDRLLVVTFTAAAAAQMRERVEAALALRADAEPDNGHLQRQLTLIHNAKITTIDSFCLDLIRNHFHEIGLDPDFKTADDGELKLLKQDVLKELLEERFARKEEAFLHCVECFVPGGQESRLEELILQIYEFSMSYPWPREWLMRAQADDSAASLEALWQAPWFGLLLQSVRQTLQACAQQLAETKKLCSQPDGPYMYEDALEADAVLVERLQRAAQSAQSAQPMQSMQAVQELYEELTELAFVRLAAKKDASVSPDKRERAKKERERVKSMLTGLRERYFYAAPKSWLEEMRQAAPALHTLLELAMDFQSKLDAKKREKNLLDFADMEHMALQILLKQGPDHTVSPTKTALEYRQYFKEIMIDEYQDSNLVQEFLLQSISGEDEGRFDRFMVGDVKQSIYKFRLARPELFMEKFDAYQKAGTAHKKPDCVRVDLKQNFRSRQEVTDCVNDIFGQVMHRELGGVEYDSDAALYPAAVFPAAEEADGEAGAAGTDNPYEPEFLISVSGSGEKENGKEREARMIAHRIHGLVGRLPVRDPESGRLRPASFRDIVILLRTTTGWDETFKKVLEECGIPAHVTSKTGYFAAPEVQNVLNFLRVLNNPLQDIPMFGVLHSAIGGFSDAQIAQLAASDEGRKKKLYDCLKLAAAAPETAGADRETAEKARSFLTLLQRFREYAVYLPIHTLIERFLEETGYLFTVSVQPGGTQRRTNVEMLLARAESFEKSSYSGLFHFIRYIEQMEKYNIDYGETGTVDENADIVRIMSIHKSKGLEFPVCFVAGLSKRFNRQDAARPVIMDMDLGIASDCIDCVRRTKKTTLKKNVLAQKLVTDSLGEELRVLYVAMARAEEKLILCASCKEEKAPAKEQSAVSMPQLWEAGSFYDILLPAWQAAGRPVQCRAAAEFLQEELCQTAAEKNARQRLECSEPSAYLDTAECRALLMRLKQGYAHENLKELFVKTTVSELKKAGMKEMQEPGAELFPEIQAVPYLPRFVKEEEETVSGTTRGSAYHRLLEIFPFGQKEAAANWTAEEVKAVIAQKRESRELTGEYAAAVNPDKIAAFLRTKLAARMQKAQQANRLKREQPFVLGISADRLKSGLPAEETVLIQGIIDVFFEEDGELVVADYKTDKVAEDSELVRRYQVQLDYYAQALERLCGMRVKEKVIYSFALEKEIAVP